MKRVEAIIRPDRFDNVSQILEEEGFGGFTIADVRGHGQSPEKVGEWRGQTYELSVTHKLQIALIVEDDEVQAVVKAIITGARTGALGDGLVAVSDVAAVYSIRTGGLAEGAKT
ncbi:MAG TPA: P-II family nitrogen regulator [Acidimicrobiales bacterium]|nr:P-II family nitrogen regulator [Acidimicrobiales bacterium]